MAARLRGKVRQPSKPNNQIAIIIDGDFSIQNLLSNDNEFWIDKSFSSSQYRQRNSAKRG
jgi:hypothetical protein